MTDEELDTDAQSSEAEATTPRLSAGLGETSPREVNGYSIKETLGQGAFAVVRRCEKTDGEYAVKIFEKATLRRKGNRTFRNAKSKSATLSALDKVYLELKMMRTVSVEHPNLVMLYDWLDDQENDKLYMFMELVRGGTVMVWDSESRTFACRVTGAACGVDRAAKYVYDVANGLSFLHAHHIAHRDLKPDNVLLTGAGRCKISDLGVARHFEELDGQIETKRLSRSARHVNNANLQKSRSRAMVRQTEGTYHYWAPEMLENDEFNALACDVWALGVCFYNFLTARLPFDGDALDEIFDMIKAAPLDLETSFASDDDLVLDREMDHLRRLLAALLERDLAKRATLHDLLYDDWLTTKAADNIRTDRLLDFRRAYNRHLSGEEFRDSLRQPQPLEAPTQPLTELQASPS